MIYETLTSELEGEEEGTTETPETPETPETEEGATPTETDKEEL